MTSLAAIVTAAPPAMAGGAPTGIPQLSTPGQHATVAANPILSWTAVAGAAKYRVQISTTDSFAALTYNKDTVALRATPEADLPTGDLYWRVAATDGSTGIGPFSAVGHFTKSQSAGPTLSAPADEAVLQFPSNPAVFSWEPVATAKSYRLFVDDASDFVNASEYTTANTAYTLTEPLTVGQPFYWRVQATLTSNAVSLPSQTRSFTYSWFSSPLTPPTLVSPENTTSVSVTDVVFAWQPVPGAKTYELQVSPNGDWANNKTIDATVRGTRYSPPSTLNNSSYFWRVRGSDAGTLANWGPWSAEWQFTRAWLDRPTITAPAWDPAQPATIPRLNGAPVFSWTPVAHASSYEIEVSTDINFSSSSTCVTNHTTWTPYHRSSESGCSLNPTGTGLLYYWHVRGRDDPAGILGLWSNTDTSDTFRFIRDPAMPEYVSPADGAFVATPTLQWTTVQGAETYRVTIKKANNTTVVGFPVTTYATTYTPTAALTASEGPFLWYVQAVDYDGVTSVVPASNTWRTFSLIAATPSVPLTLTEPADATSSVRMPALAWTDYPGATKYTVHYAANGFEFPALVTNQPYAAYTKTGAPLTPDVYTWWVEAFDSGGTSLALSAERTFVIEAPGVLDAAGYLGPPKCEPASPCTALTDTPTLTWSPVAHASAYEVTVAYDPNFTNLLRTYTTAYTRLTPRDSLVDNQAGQAFYWYVRPCVEGTCGPGPQNDTANDNASAFQKRSNAIELSAPADGTTVTAGLITFSWHDFLATNQAADVPAAQEAKQYHLEVSTTADFSNEIDDITVDQTTYTAYNKTYPEGPLYWHVQAVDGSGNLLTFSDANSPTWSLIKSSPIPAATAPSAGATVTGVPWLQWDSVAFAASYTVEVYRAGDVYFSPANRVVQNTTKFSAYAPTSGLPTDDYAWRVRRLDADGRAGAWSGARLFTLRAFAPTLLAPGDASVVNSNNLLFSWTAVANASRYKWEFSSTSAFVSVSSYQNTVMAAWAPYSTLPDGTSYWRVKVLDGADNVIGISGVRSIVKDANSPTVTSKSPTYSLGVLGPLSASFAEPVVGVSPTTFKLAIAGTSTYIAGAVSPSAGTVTRSATFTPSAPLIPGQSYTASLTSGITDLVGNPLVPSSWTVAVTTQIENNSPALREVWDRDTTPAASGGAFSASRTGGSVVTFTFTGTSVALVGLRSRSGGYAAIYVDGVRKVSALSFYSSVTQWRRTMYSQSGLANTTHTLQVRVLGTKPSVSSNTWVYVDAFWVGAAGYAENNARVTYRFNRLAASSCSGRSYDELGHVSYGDNGTRPQYSMQFKGTRVYVYGVKSRSSGKAAIYIDGALRATVNLNGITAYRAMIYGSSALTNKTHSIRIDILGTSTGSTSTVGIDYLQVT